MFYLGCRVYFLRPCPRQTPGNFSIKQDRFKILDNSQVIISTQVSFRLLIKDKQRTTLWLLCDTFMEVERSSVWSILSVYMFIYDKQRRIITKKTQVLIRTFIIFMVTTTVKQSYKCLLDISIFFFCWKLS